MGNGLVTWLKAGMGASGLGRFRLQFEALWQGGWLLIATVVTGIFNYLSNVLVGRMLRPADYGIFTSLASLSLILGVVTGVVQTVTSNYTARLRARGAKAEAGALFVYLVARLLPWGIGGTLLLALLSGPLSTFLRIPSAVPVIVLSLAVIPAVVLPAVYGAMGGLQRFGALGATQIGGSVFRLIAVVVLISLGLGAAGAVASLPISNLGASLLGAILLHDVLRQRARAAQISGLLEYSLYVVLATFAFAVLTNSDLIVVKNRFSPTEAGLYSAFATLGKITLWLPWAVGILLLPKVTELHMRGQPTAGLVCKSLFSVGLLCGSVTVVFFLFPSLVVRTVFGEQYLASASLLGLYGLAMTLYSLVNVWLIYYLAVQDKCYAYVLLLGAVLQVSAMAIIGTSLAQVVIILVITGFVLCVAGEVLFWSSKRIWDASSTHDARSASSNATRSTGGDSAARPPLVSAIVVHYSAPAELLDECLKSLLATRYDALEVVLVLNGTSQEKCFQILEKWNEHGRVQVICLKSNLGYGGGANEGAKYAHGKYIAVLNDDIEFETSWLEPIVDVMESQTGIGACQPKIRSKVNSAFFDYAGAAGGMLDIFGYPFARGRVFWTVERDRGQYDGNGEPDVFWASGTAMIVRRSAWEKVGGFDPVFFLYAEEVDFCWQLHRLGYRVVCIPRSVIYHWGSASTKSFGIKRTFLISRNHLVLVLKNYSFWQLCFLLPIRLSLELTNVIYALSTKQPEWAGAILHGLWSAATSPLSILRSRQRLAPRAHRASDPPFYRGSVVFDYFIRRQLTCTQLYNGNKCDLSQPAEPVTQIVSALTGDYRLTDVSSGEICRGEKKREDI